MDEVREALEHLDALRGYIVRDRDTVNEVIAMKARDWARKWYASRRYVEGHHVEDPALECAEREAKIDLLTTVSMLS